MAWQEKCNFITFFYELCYMQEINSTNELHNSIHLLVKQAANTRKILHPNDGRHSGAIVATYVVGEGGLL